MACILSFYYFVNRTRDQGEIMNKADLHIHSIYSDDAISKPETIMQIAADHGIRFLAITDDHPELSRPAFLSLSHHYDIHIIYGQEIKLVNGKYIDGEVLGLFLKHPIQSKRLPNILAEIQQQDAILSLAHPFCERRGEFRAYDQIDDWSRIAIEVQNGRTSKKRDNEMAAGLAERLQLPITAGSDAHSPFEIGSVYLEFDGSTVDDLRNAIQNRDLEVKGKSSNTFFTFLSAIGRLGLSL